MCVWTRPSVCWNPAYKKKSTFKLFITVSSFSAVSRSGRGLDRAPNPANESEGQKEVIVMRYQERDIANEIAEGGH